jgi:hypothetical protein
MLMCTMYLQVCSDTKTLWKVGWLIMYGFMSHSRTVHLYTWRHYHYRWRAAKFRPMLGAQGLWSERDLYRAKPAVTRGLSFSGLIRRMAPFSRLFRHTRGCGGSNLIRILVGVKPGMKLAQIIIYVLTSANIWWTTDVIITHLIMMSQWSLTFLKSVVSCEHMNKNHGCSSKLFTDK